MTEDQVCELIAGAKVITKDLDPIPASIRQRYVNFSVECPIGWSLINFMLYREKRNRWSAAVVWNHTISTDFVRVAELHPDDHIWALTIWHFQARTSSKDRKKIMQELARMQTPIVRRLNAKDERSHLDPVFRAGAALADFREKIRRA